MKRIVFGLVAAAVLFATGGLEAQEFQIVVNAGAEVNARNAEGSTALMGAALQGHIAVVQVLLDGGADKAIVDGQTATALVIARSRGFTEIVELLERHR